MVELNEALKQDNKEEMKMPEDFKKIAKITMNFVFTAFCATVALNVFYVLIKLTRLLWGLE